MKLLAASDFRSCLADLLERSLRINIAVAWATDGPVFEMLMKAPKRCAGELVIGTSMCITDPDILEKLGERYIVRVVEDNGCGLFHSKMYLFDQGNSRIAIIGSNNLTASGFTINDELAVRFEADLVTWEHAQAVFDSYYRSARSVDEQWLSEYRDRRAVQRNAEIFKRENGELNAGRVRATPRMSTPRTAAELLESNWPQYLRAIVNRVERHPDLGRQFLDGERNSYLHTLRTARPLVTRQFSTLSDEDKKVMLGGKNVTKDGTLDFGPFCNLMAARKSTPLLRGSRPSDNALRVFDIMATSQVHRRDHVLDKVLEAGRQFYEQVVSTKGFGAPFATRFLTLARPDVFFPVNSKCIRELKKFFGNSVVIDSWEGYSDCLQRVHAAKWYLSTQPAEVGVERELWQARVGIMDGYFYDPRSDA